MGIGEAGEKLRRSTVQVWNGGRLSGSRSSGSGVIWDSSGAIVTNAHVVRSGDITVELWDGRAARARLDRRDDWRDLAILRVETGRLDPAAFGDSSRVRAGEIVIAVGNPMGFTGALSTGIIHGVGPVPGIGGQPFIQTTVRLAPGNSGGPLADAGGNVIGINAAIVSGGLGLAVPVNAVRRLLTAGPPAELGVVVRPVRIPRRNGRIALLVLNVAAGSTADYVSLRQGDLLVAAEGRSFESAEDLREVLDRSTGRSVTIQFLRGGQTKKREVTIRLTQGLAA
jgi:serine protease Do